MKLPKKLHDGDLVKVGRRCWAEYIHTTPKDGVRERVAIRFTDEVGYGVMVEGEDICNMQDFLQLACSRLSVE